MNYVMLILPTAVHGTTRDGLESSYGLKLIRGYGTCTSYSVLIGCMSYFYFHWSLPPCFFRKYTRRV